MPTAHSPTLTAKPVWVVRHVPVGMRFQKSPIQKRAAALPDPAQRRTRRPHPCPPSCTRLPPRQHLTQNHQPRQQRHCPPQGQQPLGSILCHPAVLPALGNSPPGTSPPSSRPCSRSCSWPRPWPCSSKPALCMTSSLRAPSSACRPAYSPPGSSPRTPGPTTSTSPS